MVRTRAKGVDEIRIIDKAAHPRYSSSGTGCSDSRASVVVPNTQFFCLGFFLVMIGVKSGHVSSKSANFPDLQPSAFSEPIPARRPKDACFEWLFVAG